MANPLPILDSDFSSRGGVNPDEAHEKLDLLRQTLKPLLGDGVLVAFSGGVDSAFLLWVARMVQEVGAGRIVALTTTSASTPHGDRMDAMAFTRSLGVQHRWRESLEISLSTYARNDRARCYHCKVELFRIAGEVAQEEGLKWLLYGYNASDQGDDRPGHRAAQEAGVLSPLKDSGLTKAEIRFLMNEAGLPLAEKPASPCLSSRIMTGIEVTPERLRDVEAIEGILREVGVSTVRVRICRAEDDAHFLRVEVAPEELAKVLECREDLTEAGIARGYRWVTLDLGGYRTGGGVS
jgi:uncharacterized protein